MRRLLAYGLVFVLLPLLASGKKEAPPQPTRVSPTRWNDRQDVPRVKIDIRYYDGNHTPTERMPDTSLVWYQNLSLSSLYSAYLDASAPTGVFVTLRCAIAVNEVVVRSDERDSVCAVSYSPADYTDPPNPPATPSR
jgi:hypothetical protein